MYLHRNGTRTMNPIVSWGLVSAVVAYALLMGMALEHVARTIAATSYVLSQIKYESRHASLRRGLGAKSISIYDDPGNSFFPKEALGSPASYEAKECPMLSGIGLKCRLTREDPHMADARLFHIPNMQQLNMSVLPERSFDTQVYLGFASETPLYYSWLADARFMAQFDHTFGYPATTATHTNVALGPYSWNGMRRTRELRVPGYAAELDFTQELMKDIARGDDARARDGIFWMASNCGAKNARHALAKRIIETPSSMRVHSYGSCMHTRDPSLPKSPRRATHAEHDSSKLVVMREYAFDLAFENSHCEEYVTEKVWHSLAAGTIPVFFGTSMAWYLLPAPDAAIFAQDFASPKELMAYLSKLDVNPALRAKHLRWRADFAAYAISGQPGELAPEFIKLLEYSKRVNQEDNLLCLMCAKVHELKRVLEAPDLGREKAKGGAGPYPSCAENVDALKFAYS